jgi:hypothetical protein
MDIDDKVKVAKFLADDYIFDVKVTVGACPVCFKNGKIQTIKASKDSKRDSPTSRGEARRRRFEMWMELFEEGGLDPIQLLNVYIPAVKHGSFTQIPKISYPLIITTQLGPPCADKSTCQQVCLICNTFLEPDASTTVAPWTTPVHKVCCDPCGFTHPGAPKGVHCKTPALTIQKLFKDSLGICIRCPQHSRDYTAPPAAKIASKEAPAPPTDSEVKPPRAKPEAQPNQVVKLKPPKQRRLLPIERNKETGSYHIGRMMCPDKYAPPSKTSPGEVKRFKADDPTPPSRGPGAAFLYGAKHFDFSEPKRFNPAASSDDLAHQEDEHEAGPGAGDREHRTP